VLAYCPLGQYASTTEEALKYLLDSHFPGNTTQLVVNPRALIHQASQEDWEIAQEIVTEERLKWAISLYAPLKSPGLDGIFPALLQKGLDIILSRLIPLLARRSLSKQSRALM